MHYGDFGLPLFDTARLSKNATVGKLRLLADILPDLGDCDPAVRARAASQFSDIVAIAGLSWGAVAYVR